MIRIPDPGRFELRLMDGSANPYLLQASVLAASLDGLKNKINPGKLKLNKIRLNIQIFLSYPMN